MIIQFCLAVLAVCAGCILAETIETRIVNGEVAAGVIPYQVALYIDNSFACGGSLLTKNCILTAAHCVKGVASDSFKIRAGILKLDSNAGVTRAISKAFLPSTYNASTMHYDVAILKLKAPMSGTNIEKIAMNKAALSVGEQLRVSGWGLTNESGSVSNQLRYVFVPAISKEECNEQYSGKISNTMFCAAPQGGGKDACSGDSGGPIVRDNRQYGIVSWGVGCARANYAGVYTSIRQVLPWITQVRDAYCI